MHLLGRQFTREPISYSIYKANDPDSNVNMNIYLYKSELHVVRLYLFYLS